MKILETFRENITLICSQLLKFAVVGLQLFELAIVKRLLPEDQDNYRSDDNENQCTLIPSPRTPKEDGVKRIKLMVDIDISPGGSPQVVHLASRNVMDETTEKPSKLAQIVSKSMLAMLRCSEHLKRKIILSMFVEDETREGSANTTPRKIITPVRRVFKTYPLFGPHELLVIPENNIQSNSLYSENTLQRSFTEKRKHSDNGEWEFDLNRPYADLDLINTDDKCSALDKTRHSNEDTAEEQFHDASQCEDEISALLSAIAYPTAADGSEIS